MIYNDVYACRLMTSLCRASLSLSRAICPEHSCKVCDMAPCNARLGRSAEVAVVHKQMLAGQLACTAGPASQVNIHNAAQVCHAGMQTIKPQP